MFTNLKKHVMQEAASKKENTRFYIENGYFKSWAKEHHIFSDKGIAAHCTARRWDQYKAGEISREKIIDLTIKRAEKEIDKDAAEKIEKLETAAAAGDFVSVAVSVEWKRNATWGYNPTATVTIHAAGGWEQYTGSASGCGYDKETAAIGAALNQSASVLKMLYTAKEKALAEFTPDQTAAACNFYGVESNRDFIHYGAGYGVLPYFEGGVGMSSFRGVFEKCGYKCTNENHTKHAGFYYFSKVEE